MKLPEVYTDTSCPHIPTFALVPNSVLENDYQRQKKCFIFSCLAVLEDHGNFPLPKKMEKKWPKKLSKILTCKSFHLAVTCLSSLYTGTDRNKIKVHFYLSKMLVYSGANCEPVFCIFHMYQSFCTHFKKQWMKKKITPYSISFKNIFLVGFLIHKTYLEGKSFPR